MYYRCPKVNKSKGRYIVFSKINKKELDNPKKLKAFFDKVFKEKLAQKIKSNDRPNLAHRKKKS